MSSAVCKVFTFCNTALYYKKSFVSSSAKTSFAKHANATRPHANVLDLLIIPSSSCSKQRASQAFRDTPDIFVYGHLHQPSGEGGSLCPSL